MTFSVHAQLSAPLARLGLSDIVKMREWAGSGTRTKLARWWGPVEAERNWLPWIMLNPSTATGVANDPTLRRIIAFSHRWGFNGLVVVNVYPFRTPSPRELSSIVLGWDKRGDWWVRDEIWRNIDFIAGELVEFDAAMVAWGAPAGALAFETELWTENLFDRVNDPDGPRKETLKLWCLGTTKGGDPVHPLARGKHRVPDDIRPVRYRNPGTIEIGEVAL